MAVEEAMMKMTIGEDAQVCGQCQDCGDEAMFPSIPYCADCYWESEREADNIRRYGKREPEVTSCHDCDCVATCLYVNKSGVEFDMCGDCYYDVTCYNHEMVPCEECGKPSDHIFTNRHGESADYCGPCFTDACEASDRHDF